MLEKYDRDNLSKIYSREDFQACRKHFGFLVDEYDYTLNQVTINYDYYDGLDQVIFEFLKFDSSVRIKYENLYTRDFSYDLSVVIERDGSKKYATWSTLVTKAERLKVNEPCGRNLPDKNVDSRFEKVARHVRQNSDNFLGPAPGPR